MSLNKVMLIGNVGKDPEVRYLENNPQNPGANPKMARFPLERFVRKGTQVYIEGRLRTRKYTDSDGKDRYTTEIVVENIQLLGKRPEDGAAPLAGGQPQGGYQQQRPQQPQQGYAQGGYQGGYQQPAQPAAPAYQQPAAPVQQEAAPSDDLPF